MTEQELRNLYDAYIEEALRVEQAHKPTDGLFGFGKKTSDDPCHDRFASDLEQRLSNFASNMPESASVRCVLSFIYTAHIDRKEPRSAYWMLIAVHGLTLPLIPLLSKEDAGTLLEEYSTVFPRRERFPAQKKLIAELKKAVN